MRFAAQSWLFAIAAAPLLWLWLRRGDVLVKRDLSALLGARAAAHVEGVLPHLRRQQRLLLLLGVASLAVALARPQWGARELVVHERGTDVVIALDISNSMLTEDVPPSRLGQARAGLDAFLARLDRGRVGLVLFAGAAYVQCPLTLDYGTARLFLGQADPDMITAQGTGLAQALVTARGLLERGTGPTAATRRAIVLVTDGEDFGGGWAEEAERCREANIAILAVPVGEARGGLIPARDPGGRGAGFLKDDGGQVVLSRADPAVLEQMARATDGAVLPSGPAGVDAARLVAEVTRLGERDLEERRIAAFEERFAWPLGLALVCLIARELWRPLRRRLARFAADGSPGPERVASRRFGGARWRRRRGGAAAAGCLLALLLVSCSGARAAPPAPGLRPPGAAEADRGRALYREGRYADALRAFTAARALNPSDPRLSLAVGETLARLGRATEAVAEFRRAGAQADGAALRAESLYNAGTALLAAGQTEAAAQALRQSLAIEPERDDALHNLEIAVREAERQQQEQSSEDQKSQGQEEQQEQQSPQDGSNQQQRDNRSQADTSRASQEQQDQDQQQKQGRSGQEQPRDAQPQTDQTGAPNEQRQNGQTGDAAAAAAGSRGAPGDMTRDEAFDLLRALDRDEAELRQSVQKRLEGATPVGGKRW